MDPSAESIRHLVNRINQIVHNQSTGSLSAESRQCIVHAARDLISAVQDPRETAFNVTTSSCTQAAIQTAIGMGIFRAYGEISTPTMTVQRLAEHTGSSVGLIIRIMRVLVANGVFSEPMAGCYARTLVTQCFVKPTFSTFMLGTASRVWEDMKILPDYLASLQFRDPGELKTDPSLSQYWNNTTLDYWEWLEKNPVQMDAYNKTMERSIEVTRSHGSGSFASMYPFAEELGRELAPEDAVLVDVGGGRGQALEDVRRHAPNLTGRMVLEDRAETLKDHICGVGVECLPHNFFQPQPIKGALAYLFRHVLHDWPDQLAREILLQTVPALVKGKSRILIAERVLPNLGCSQLDATWDLIMMRHSGKERTESQWHDLLGSAGLRISQIWPCEGEEMIIEGMLE